MESDCKDIRVYNGESLLKTWIGEDTCNTTSTDLYFLIPSISASENVSLIMYYGNSELSDIHNGTETFPIYFDDFERANLLDYTDSQGRIYRGYSQANGGTLPEGDDGQLYIQDGVLYLPYRTNKHGDGYTFRPWRNPYTSGKTETPL